MRFEEAKVTKQQPLPPTVEKGPGKVIPEKRKPGEESESGSGSDSDSSDDEVTFLKKLVSANAFTEAFDPFQTDLHELQKQDDQLQNMNHFRVHKKWLTQISKATKTIKRQPGISSKDILSTDIKPKDTSSKDIACIDVLSEPIYSKGTLYKLDTLSQDYFVHRDFVSDFSCRHLSYMHFIYSNLIKNGYWCLTIISFR